MEKTAQMEIALLVKGAKDKDQRSIEALYKMYYPRMKGVCIKIVKTDEDAVHDLVQNAFILALASLHTLHNEERFGEWLTTITRNVALKYLQKKSRIRFIPLSELSSEDTSMTMMAEGADALVNLNDIKAFVQQLPKGYGEIFRLSVIEGYSHIEIGNMLGIAPHSSSSQLTRAKALLRQMLREKQLPLVIILLLTALPCVILWLRQRTTDEKELAKDTFTPKKEYDGTTPTQTDSVGLTIRDVPPFLAGGVTRHVVTVASDNRADSLGTTRKNCAEIQEVDSVSVTTPSLAAEQDSIATKADSLVRSLNQPEMYLAQRPSKSKNSGWQLMAGGAINFAADDTRYKSIAVSGDFPEPDGPISGIPTSINTWEEYAEVLRMEMYDNPSEETQALLDVAERNSGEIAEQEHHRNPISIGIALSRKVNEKLSVETGLQYDRLNSRFVTGSLQNNIEEEQRIDYLGVPLGVTYRLFNHKPFTLYGMAGIVLHIPLHGSSASDYMVDGLKTYHFESTVNAPLQWTVPLGLGVQYQLTPHVGIYAQPTLNWHIPGNSSVRTMWTEYPWQVTVPIGIRFTW